MIIYTKKFNFLLAGTQLTSLVFARAKLSLLIVCLIICSFAKKHKKFLISTIPASRLISKLSA